MNREQIIAAVQSGDSSAVGWYANFLIEDNQWVEEQMLQFFDDLGCDRETVETLIDNYNWNNELLADVAEMGGF